VTQRFRLYTTVSCPYCLRAKALLARRGWAYEEIDLTADPDARAALVARTGMRTVPQIFLDGVLLGGYDELQALDRSGELTRRYDTLPSSPPTPRTDA
jgi:glutaredoxin 3